MDALNNAPGKTRRAVIDLGRSVPPLVPEVGAALREALLALGEGPEPGLLLHKAGGAGALADREAASLWLGTRLIAAPDPARIVIANGTQVLVRTLFETFAGPSRIVLAEALSYGVIRQIAALSGIQLVGVPIDGEGMIPDAIEPLVRHTGAKLIYCNPTVQNPTTAIIPVDRRRAIAGITARLGLTIIEDDVLGPLHPNAPPPIATFAPEQTWYIQSTTKTLAHGLRVAYGLAPSSAALGEFLMSIRRLSFWVAPPLSLAVLTRWIEGGMAHHILEAVRNEGIAREEMARKAFGQAVTTKPGSFHVWLATGDETGSAFAERAALAGVIVRAARDFAVEPPDDDPPFVRLSVSSPLVRHDLALGLDTLCSVFRLHAG